jgi:hypothetical protein
MARQFSRTASELQFRLDRHPDRCPICDFVSAAVARHVDALFYELVTDPPVREAIRKAGGFCRRHADVVALQADALGSALILGDVLRSDLRAMDEGEFDRPPNTVGTVARILDGSLPGRAPCVVCRQERGLEEMAVDSLIDGLHDPETIAAFERSSGLCLPHFRLAFRRCDDSVVWRRVLDTERAALTRLTGELDVLARHFDHQAPAAEVGAEADAWKRALYATSGWPEEA